MNDKKKMKGLPQRILSFVLTLMMVLTLMPSMGANALIGFEEPIINVTLYPSGCLKSMEIKLKLTANYGTAYGRVAVHNKDVLNSYNWNHFYKTGESDWSNFDEEELKRDAGLVAIQSANDAFDFTVPESDNTVEFEDGVVDLNTDQTYYVYLWSRQAGTGYIYIHDLIVELKTENGQLKTSSGEVINDGKDAGDLVTTKTFSFSYAADCQRNPSYPKKGNSFEAYGFGNPLYGNQTFGSTMSGDWKLVSKELYTGNSADYVGNYGIDSVMSSASSEYGIDKTAIEVYELKDGDTHIAYGVLCGIFDGSALYIGDTWSGGAGYVLSNKDLTTIESISGTVTQDVTTGFEELPAACECADEDKDHKCDYCGKVLSECADENKDHKCDYCGETLSEHTDEDKDHKCDYCGKVLSECADENKDHKCDYCGKVLSECADENKDHKCDLCGKVMSDHVDANCDHICDYCGDEVYLCPSDKFTDAPKYDNWAHVGIDYCVVRGLMKGISNTEFAPQLATSRAMIVTILWRLENAPIADYAMSFKDVKDGKWYTEAIRWAQSTGVVVGYSAEEFGPDDPVTREQMAAIFYRYCEFKGMDVSAEEDLSIFEDANKISSWAVDSVAWANAAGLIIGTSATTLDPSGLAAREQVAAMLYRFCENIVK